MHLNDRHCKFPIGEVSDNEFYLIHVSPKSVEVGPVIPFGFARRGAFHVKNNSGPPVHAFSRDKTAGLDQHLVTAVAKRGDEWEHRLLCERFTARDFDEITAEFLQLFEYLIKRHPLSARKGVFAVAPDATHRAARQPHK